MSVVREEKGLQSNQRNHFQRYSILTEFSLTALIGLKKNLTTLSWCCLTSSFPLIFFCKITRIRKSIFTYRIFSTKHTGTSHVQQTFLLHQELQEYN